MIKKSKSKESFLHKEPAKGENTPQKNLSSSCSSSPIPSDSQSTTFSTSKSNDSSFYKEYLLSLGEIYLSNLQLKLATDINIKNINLDDANNDKDKEMQKKGEDFEINSEKDYLGKKKKIRFKSIKIVDSLKTLKSDSKMKFNVYRPYRNIIKKFVTNNSDKIKYGLGDGKWSFDEHIKYIEGIAMYGKNWSNISKYVGTRTPIQVRSHSQKFYHKLKAIEDNEFNINFQNKNIKNIFDMLYLIKERNKSNNNEKEYIINVLTSLTKNLNYKFLTKTEQDKVNDKNDDFKKVNEKNVANNNIEIIEDSEKKIDDSKIKIDTDINDKLIDSNIKEKEEKKTDDNYNDKKEEEVYNEYINTSGNQKFIFDDGVLISKNELTFSDIIYLDKKKRNYMQMQNQNSLYS